MKKILFLLAVTAVSVSIILVFMVMATLCLPSVNDLVSLFLTYVIMNVVAIYAGWHEDLWADIIENRPLRKYEDEDIL